MSFGHSIGRRPFRKVSAAMFVVRSITGASIPFPHVPMKLRFVLRRAIKLAYDPTPSPRRSRVPQPYQLSVWFDVLVVVVFSVLDIGLWF
jgi:hypothetical protein